MTFLLADSLICGVINVYGFLVQKRKGGNHL